MKRIIKGFLIAVGISGAMSLLTLLALTSAQADCVEPIICQLEMATELTQGMTAVYISLPPGQYEVEATGGKIELYREPCEQLAFEIGVEKGESLFKGRDGTFTIDRGGMIWVNVVKGTSVFSLRRMS